MYLRCGRGCLKRSLADCRPRRSGCARATRSCSNGSGGSGSRPTRPQAHPWRREASSSLELAAVAVHTDSSVRRGGDSRTRFYTGTAVPEHDAPVAPESYTALYQDSLHLWAVLRSLPFQSDVFNYIFPQCRNHNGSNEIIVYGNLDVLHFYTL